MRRSKEEQRAYYAANRDRCRRASIASQDRYPPAKRLFITARGRAKKFNRVFFITVQDIEAQYPIDERCPLCGVSFERRTRYTASFDEIIPGKGYHPWNIMVICYRCNTHKNHHPPEWFLKIVYAMGVAMHA